MSEKGYFLNFPFLCARVSGKISRTARLHAGPQWTASESWAVELIFCKSKSRETFPFGNRHIISTMLKIKGIILIQGQNTYTLKISTDCYSPYFLLFIFLSCLNKYYMKTSLSLSCQYICLIFKLNFFFLVLIETHVPKYIHI